MRVRPQRKAKTCDRPGPSSNSSPDGRAAFRSQALHVPDICIETDRLILRPPRIEDFDAYAASMADLEAARFIGGQQPRAVAWRGFLSSAGAWMIQGFSMFSVIEKASGRWVGRLGPWFPDGWPGTEV